MSAKHTPWAVPNPGSPEASAMIDSVLAEYNYPSNMKNAARAGYVAAMRLLTAAPQASQQVAVPDASWAVHHNALSRAVECLEILNQRPRPMCRDCADCNGVCPNSGLNCNMTALFSSCRDALAKLAAPQAPSREPWQPIETAPKDGTLFLCWVSAVRYGETDEGQQYQQDVSQVDFCNWRTQADIEDCGWFDPCCGQIGDSQGITHWMPLPAEPEATGGQQ